MEVATPRAGARVVPGVRLLPVLFSAAIFWSAALLFWIEPLLSKQLLPLLGGSPGVWNTCLVFFQAMLLAGYACAHLLAARLSPRRAVQAYLGILALAALALVIGLSGASIPREAPTGAPIPWLLLTLLSAIGLPFFALAATGPTLQRWFSLTNHPAARDPYFLYAASNLGSMIGLLAFPSLLEPFVSTGEQAGQWRVGFLLLLALAAACAAVLGRAGAPAALSGNQARTPEADPAGDPAAAPAAGATASPAPLTVWRRARWVLLASVPSSLLLGVTTHLTTDIAAVPLLWIVPLAIYLATFTLAFASHPPIPRKVALWGTPLLAGAWLVSLPVRWDLPHWVLFGLPLALLFFAALACHGELARDRPAPERLTEFYFWISLGGVLGGAFNALLAPLVFTNVVEYPLAILLAVLVLPAAAPRLSRKLSLALDILVPVACWILAVLLFRKLGSRDDWWPAAAAAAPVLLALPFARRPWRVGLALAAIYVTLAASDQGTNRPLYAHRDFYGRIRVLSTYGGRYHELLHGTTLHGKQDLRPPFRRAPITYYGRLGPVGNIFQVLQGRTPHARVATVGLGTGTLASYARPGESWTFYELNPAIVRVATDPHLFTYLGDAAVRPRVLLGDARLRLREAPAGAYDLIILDAFSSDAIPVHLVTREAVQMYAEKLAPHGFIIFNISNRYLDLEPVLSAVAEETGLVAWYRDHGRLTSAEEKVGLDRSEWVVLARSREDLGALQDDEHWKPLLPAHRRAWSDDFSGLLSIVRW